MLCSGDARRPHHCLVYYLYKHIERDGDEALRKVLGRDHYDDDEGELTEYAGMNALSKAERDYISGGMAAGVREDGRNPTEVRCLEVEKDVIPHVNGSSHVKIQDSIEVLCSVKLDVAEPDPRMNDRAN